MCAGFIATSTPSSKREKLPEDAPVHKITGAIQAWLTETNETRAAAQKHLDWSIKRAESQMLIQDAQKPTAHRFKFPEYVLPPLTPVLLTSTRSAPSPWARTSALRTSRPPRTAYRLDRARGLASTRRTGDAARATTRRVRSPIVSPACADHSRCDTAWRRGVFSVASSARPPCCRAISARCAAGEGRGGSGGSAVAYFLAWSASLPSAAWLPFFFFFPEHRPAAEMTTAGTSGSKLRLRTSFARGDALEPFYAGGHVAVTSDGARLATAFHTHVHIVEAATSRIVHKIDGVRPATDRRMATRSMRWRSRRMTRTS